MKNINIKSTYSFTSHITVYETCGLQYKFYRELEFLPVRENAMLFGMLVHETIEDIHRAALRNEAHTITDSNIESWLEANYASLSKATHSYLSARQLAIALSHVTGYAEHQHGNWAMIQQAEFDVSLVKPDAQRQLELYRRQLHIYAHLVEQRTG